MTASDLKTLTAYANRIGDSDAMKYWKQRASLLKPETWRAIIEPIPWEKRGHVASIVWWDFFGGRMVVNHWGHLDDFMSEYIPLDRGELIAGLISVGYPTLLARKRCQESLWEEVA